MSDLPITDSGSDRYGIDCYDGCPTGDCDACGLYVDTLTGWRYLLARVRAWYLITFRGWCPPVNPNHHDRAP